MNNFQFYAGNHISGTAEAESPNSEYMYRIYQVLALGYQITPQWASSGSHDPFS